MVKSIIKRPELLVPAGDLEKLKTAVRFGADAVYVGGGNFSLRAANNSFDLADLREGVRFAHERGCRLYVALNIYAYDRDITPLLEYFLQAVEMGVDAVIVSDPGLVHLFRQHAHNVDIHLSTQANTTNSESLKFWNNLGVSRVVVARELSLSQIASMKQRVPNIELEVFIHGAMCMSYSGRCLLSRHMTDRSANRGDCAQPCRWEFTMKEAQRDDEFTIVEDSRGTYILNSKDLNMIRHIPQLVEAGVDSFKIEGRMKSNYYVALVTKIYREAIDKYCSSPEDYNFEQLWSDELEKVSHRPYTTGFYLQEEDMEYLEQSTYIRGYDFVGTVEGYDAATGVLNVSARNKFTVTDSLEIVDHHVQQIRPLVIKKMQRENGEYIKEAHNSYKVDCYLDNGYESVSRNSIIRRLRV